jgi:hypothetical protein
MQPEGCLGSKVEHGNHWVGDIHFKLNYLARDHPSWGEGTGNISDTTKIDGDLVFSLIGGGILSNQAQNIGTIGDMVGP